MPSMQIRTVAYLNLIPPLVESHRHRTDEGLHSSGPLIIGGSESPTDTLIVQDGHFKGEVLLQLQGEAPASHTIGSLRF